MSALEDVLREETFKEEELEVQRRVFYTLSNEKRFIEYRNSKLLALLVSHLHKTGTLSEKELDDFLLELV